MLKSLLFTYACKGYNLPRHYSNEDKEKAAQHHLRMALVTLSKTNWGFMLSGKQTGISVFLQLKTNETSDSPGPTGTLQSRGAGPRSQTPGQVGTGFGPCARDSAFWNLSFLNCTGGGNTSDTGPLGQVNGTLVKSTQRCDLTPGSHPAPIQIPKPKSRDSIKPEFLTQ